MKRFAVLFLILVSAGLAERRAKNIILFLGDAGGIPTLNAASLYAYEAPQKLFIQGMPYLALMDTSPADGWVTDSAAGMTAIVTGQKTNNGVISMSADTVRGTKDGETLKTILEFAEEHGLSTGVMSNMNMTDATPAACYAHSNDRGKSGEIFAQVVKPRYGDGVDVIIGPGRDAIFAATRKIGIEIEPALKEKGYTLCDSADGIPPEASRVVALFNSGNYEPGPAVDKAIRILSRNRKGFFLMVEWDMHTNRIKAGLDRAIQMDKLVRDAVARAGNDTLVIYAADHSFDLRVRGGRKGRPLITDEKDPKSPIRMDNSHTGEEVLVAAEGPGASRVHGYIANADLFRIMMAAYGWQPWTERRK